ncbi:matrilin-2-like isoform X3 [Cyprinodon tularosa]|uniref:matrilin-2-like isoform X3 n=1 Tax=Cyprinodon tularosa TaxID=77115 RepID=UPI0018E28C81|nr:matrilin-2-like isoform X3 [Cyprinodon tularosa]
MRSLALGLFCLFCCNAVEPERRRPKLITAKGQNNTTIQNNTMENSCETMPLDFVFVIDSSRSIRPEDYEKVKTFIINLLQFLDVGHNATRVGLLQYGSVVQPEFSLNTYYSKAEVKEAVRNMSHLATGTMTGLAIQYTMEVALTEEQGARPLSLQIPRIAMIVTDGRPQDTVEEIAAQAKQAGIQIFAIGVGRVEMKTLKAIGSEPHSEHVHLVANFSQMETLISVFKSKLCGGSDMCKVVDHQCQHICVNSPASYRCKCRKGFTLNPDGKTCKAVDTCAVVDHGCDHICVNVAEGYECRCRPGYELTIDLKTCNRIDHCDLGIHGCEHNCVSLPGSYICSCMKGYVLNSDGKTCSQIDHCANGSHGCEQEFMNTGTSCVCKCRDGYTLRPDGKTCKKVDPCADGTHGCEQEFVSTEDSCVCRCRKGFTLRPDGKTCQKVDPCADGTHGCEQEFVSTEDSCVCRCRKGFTLRPDGKTCQKVDPCADGTHGCEQEFVSTEDSCVCRCRKGFTLRPDGKTCESSDMCKVVDHQCQHICVNSPASYRCKCRKGFTLNPDGKTCKAVDTCAVVDHGCDHICVNVAEGYECRCRPGYELTIDLKTCNRIDHCDLGIHGCEHNCVSLPGSYICSCMKGYVLNSDGKTCSQINHCANGSHGCEQEFMSTATSCVCKCRDGYTLRPDGKTCKSVDLCQTLDHGCEHLCVSTTASYICKCYEGFLLAGDGKSCEKPGCLDGVMDLVFVIDGSKSLGPANFELVKQFVNSIVDSLNISRTGTHVGLIQFSTKVRTEFTLNRHTTGQDIKRAVNQMQYMGRGSMTGSALRHMFQFSFSEKEGGRSNIPRVCVVFTDGRSQDDVSEWASKAKNSGVTIYALGVGKAIEQELREIASEPSEMHLYYAEDFKKMGEITQKLKSRICKDRPADENMCRCENIILFQNQVTEQLKNLAQSIEALSKKLETLENQVVRK